MSAHWLVIGLFVWGALCYIVGLAAPWAYLSVKDAYGDNLGITEEGTSVIPKSFQNMSCDNRRMTINIWKGVCVDGTKSSCTAFDDNDAWNVVDELNAIYGQYYKHAIDTDFAGDVNKWQIIQSLLALSLAVLLACVFVYFCRASQDITCYDGSVKYVCFGLLLTSAASFGAVGTSLTTYALDHQFYTGGAYYVKGWFVYTAFKYGCEGPQYVPGPGIVMQTFGGLTVMLLASILPCQCMAPRDGDRDIQGDYVPVALSTPILATAEAEIVYEDA